MKTPLCKCNNCGDYFSDTNPKCEAPEFNVSSDTKSLVTHRCPNCETDAFLMDIESKDQLYRLQEINPS